jgi:AraC family transcriptional regulator, glycine betaine-responsive activator
MRDYIEQSITKFAFFIQDGFSLSCLSGLIDPLRKANEIVGQEMFVWSIVSETGAPVRSSADLAITPDGTLLDLEKPDILILLAHPESKLNTPKQTEARLRLLDRTGVAIGGVNGGEFSLARAGLMAGHKSSVLWCYQAAFSQEFPHLEFTDSVTTRGRRRYTASGSAAVLELALHFIGETLGHNIMTEVACWFQHPGVRNEGVAQMRPTVGRGFSEDSLPFPVRSAIKIFRENIADPVQISFVSDTLGVSGRQLERGFMQTTGMSPRNYYTCLRLRQAKHLITHSDHSISQIASLTGFSRRSDFISRYSSHYGDAPHKHKKSVNSFCWSKPRYPVPA